MTSDMVKAGRTGVSFSQKVNSGGAVTVSSSYRFKVIVWLAGLEHGLAPLTTSFKRTFPR